MQVLGWGRMLRPLEQEPGTRWSPRLVLLLLLGCWHPPWPGSLFLPEAWCPPRKVRGLLAATQCLAEGGGQGRGEGLAWVSGWGGWGQAVRPLGMAVWVVHCKLQEVSFSAVAKLLAPGTGTAMRV